MNSLRSTWVCVTLFLAMAMVSVAETRSQERRGTIQWARLKTAYRYWDRHDSAEGAIIRFISNKTLLDIAEYWRPVDVQELDTLIQYPFIFSEGIHIGLDQKARDNLREYFLRGGFLFIDACINPEVNPDPDYFLEQQKATIHRILPDAEVSAFPSDDPIFHCFFDLKEGLPHSYMNSIFDPRWAKHGLYAVRRKDHLIAIISLSGLKCGWAGLQTMPQHDVKCMEMMVNSYIYAITQ